MGCFLTGRLKATGRGTLRSGINVFRADQDYRIPDLTFISSSHGGILAVDSVRREGPTR